MKTPRSLSRKMLTQFVICIAVLLLLATPLFYILTKLYYAEDMIDIIEAVEQGRPIPTLDLERDIIEGVMIQFALISGLLGIAIVLMVRFIAAHLWKPFDETLSQIEDFRLENGVLPVLPDTDVKEFARLNEALQALMQNSLTSYRTQKEFTENASHELQTPLAVFQSKLDIMLQLPDLTQQQADMIQSLYQISGRLAQLNRNLLLLARIDNKQYNQLDTIDVVGVLDELLPFLENLTQGLTLCKDVQVNALEVKGNRVLFESLINNLIVNAVRHNVPGGYISLTVQERRFTVSNTSDEPALDPAFIFNRFYRPSEKVKGNGLGLAIVKAICDYHGWEITYCYQDNRHQFCVTF